MKTKYTQMTLFLVLAMLLCLIPGQWSMAKTKEELTKIGATAKIPDDWVLVDTDLSNEEIMKLLDIDDEVTLSSIRAQWGSSPAKIEYDIVIPDEAADILINTANASGSNIQDGNELSDGMRESLMKSVKTGLEAQGAVVSGLEETEVDGLFGWKFQMSLQGTEAYEYQVIHQGKYITFSINELNGKLTQKKKAFLDEFMDDLTIHHVSSSDQITTSDQNKLDQNKSVQNKSAASDQQTDKKNIRMILIWVLIGISAGGVFLTAIVAVAVLVLKKRKREA